MAEEQYPRLVILVTDGPLMVGSPAMLGGRKAIHTPVASPPLPPAAIAGTIMTGVSPILHGIVTRGCVDAKTQKVRETERCDRHAQALWDGTQLVVKSINWPATKGDSQVTNTQTQNEFLQIRESLDADIVCGVFPQLARGEITEDRVKKVQLELEKIVSELPIQTSVIIVHRRTDEHASAVKSIRPYAATFLVGDEDSSIQAIPHLELIGGAAFLLSGVPCPIGVKQPDWSFLYSFISESPRSFPINTVADVVDWPEVIHDFIEAEYNPGITLLIQRFTTFASVAFKKELWKELEYSSACLVQLRRKPFDLWMLLLALEQQGEVQKMESCVEQLEKLYPSITITSIAKSLVQFDSETTAENLKAIDISKISIYHSLGAYGRMCLKAGLPEKGEEALVAAIQQGVATSSDRAQLASYYYEKEKYEDSIHVLRSVGVHKGELTWQILRLKILVALDLRDESIALAKNILEQNPSQDAALNALEKFA